MNEPPKCPVCGAVLTTNHEACCPQCVDPAFPPGPQLAVLATLFVGTLAAVDRPYTVAVAEARSRFDPRRLRALDAIAGVLLMAGGLVLATMRRP